MFTVKAFAAKINHADNTRDVTNEFGEISTDSLTYAQDVGRYTHDQYDGIVLYTFNTSQDGVYTPLDLEWNEHIMKVCAFIYEQVQSDPDIYQDELRNLLMETFKTEADTFVVGEIISDDGKMCPEWISWKRKGVESKVRIWFSDKAFKRRFDEYSIVVVPALEPVDSFFGLHDEVKALVDAELPSKLSARVEKAKAMKPPTFTRYFEFDWHDRYSDAKIRTTWVAIIYGKAGDNIDSIKDAIVEQVLANSGQTKDEWKKIFPDIFKRTEFILVPQWDIFAIPNRSLVHGIYSPVTYLNGLIDKIKPYFHEYPVAHLNEHMGVMGHPYRSLSISICGGYENRDMKYRLNQVYPDYIAENSLSQDFNRMKEDTREWSEIISEMIKHAEGMTSYSDVPNGFARVKRDGKMFVSRTIGNIHYLVATKSNFFPSDDGDN